MFKVFKERWLSDRDLAKSPFGRDDPPELIEQCGDYLSQRTTGEHAAIDLSSTADRKTKAALVSAQVQASVQARLPTRDLERRLALAEATIDRLLAFVPARAKEIRDTRLDAIVEELSAKAAELLPGSRRVRVSVTPEADVDSAACHRIIVSLVVPTTLDANRFAGASTELHRWLAAATDVDEYKAIRLLIEPEPLPDT